jgi:hypothetical protein
MFHPKLIDIPPKEADCYEINNNSMKSNTAIKQLNNLAGLPWEPVDNEKIAAVNYERYKHLSEMMNKGEGEAQAQQE